MAIVIATIIKLEGEFKNLNITDEFLNSFIGKPILDKNFDPNAKIIGKINKVWVEGNKLKAEQEMFYYDFNVSGVIKSKEIKDGITIIKDFELINVSLVDLQGGN